MGNFNRQLPFFPASLVTQNFDKLWTLKELSLAPKKGLLKALVGRYDLVFAQESQLSLARLPDFLDFCGKEAIRAFVDFDETSTTEPEAKPGLVIFAREEVAKRLQLARGPYRTGIYLQLLGRFAGLPFGGTNIWLDSVKDTVRVQQLMDLKRSLVRTGTDLFAGDWNFVSSREDRFWFESPHYFDSSVGQLETDFLRSHILIPWGMEYPGGAHYDTREQESEVYGEER